MVSQIKCHGLPVPLDDSLNTIQSRLQCLQLGPVGQADEVMAGAVK